MLTVIKPCLIFVSNETIAKIDQSVRGKTFVKKIIVFGDEFLGKSNHLSYNVFVRNAQVKSREGEFVCDAQDLKKTTAMVLCSSGTTGLPKGVEISQLSFFAVFAHRVYI